MRITPDKAFWCLTRGGSSETWERVVRTRLSSTCVRSRAHCFGLRHCGKLLPNHNPVCTSRHERHSPFRRKSSQERTRADTSGVRRHRPVRIAPAKKLTGADTSGHERCASTPPLSHNARYKGLTVAHGPTVRLSTHRRWHHGIQHRRYTGGSRRTRERCVGYREPDRRGPTRPRT